VRGKEVRESTGQTDEGKAQKYLKRRVREVENDKDGIKPFAGPQAERIRISCGVIPPEDRKPDCDCLCCTLERDFRLRGKASVQNLSNLKRVRLDFALRKAAALRAEQVDGYIEQRLGEGSAPASINRVTQLLGQAFNLAIRQKRLASAPFIRHLSEAGNVRQGFYTAAEFKAILSNMPEYLQDYMRWGYRVGMRKRQIDSLLWEDQDDNCDVIRSRAVNVKNRKPHCIQLDEDLKDLIERRRAARQVIRADGTVMLARHIFHRNGQPIGDFRKAWQTACVMAGLGKFLCRDCEVTLEAGRQCHSCGQKWTKKVQPKYVGRLFHDFRRTAVRDMVRAGVPQSVAMSISGHSTNSMFHRYDITDGRDQREALRAVKAYREQQIAAQRENLAAMPAPSKGIN
jgi:integrase